MKIEFEYGKQMLQAELPDSTDIFIPGETVPDPPAIPEGELREAVLKSLREPMGMPPLTELAHEGSTVVIIIPDIVKGGCQPTSHRRVSISLILEELYSAGVRKSDITLLFSNGLHPRTNESEMLQILGQKLFDEFSYMFKQHDRIGILGDNGTGKSTLLNILTGNLKSDTGYVEIGETVRFGYFKQGYDDLPMNKRVIDFIQEISNDFKVDGQGLSAKDMLERFLFDARLQHTPISRLSGGERRRLYLLRVLMMMPNILVLDEPTNDLDIDTLNILEDYLDNFEGIVITVSHDRYFLDRICDGLFILQNQHLRYVNGGYSQNLDTSTKEEKEKSQGALAYKQSKQKKIKMTYMEKKEFEEIEDVIMNLETNLNQIEEQMNGVTDFKEIDELSRQRDDLQKQIDEKNERYIYLLELQEQIDNQ